jgi:hypothetical protein
VFAKKHESACEKRGGCNASARCVGLDFDVKTYLQELRKRLPYVPPIPVEELKSLHKTQDHKGIVRLIKVRAMRWVP